MIAFPPSTTTTTTSSTQQQQQQHLNHLPYTFSSINLYDEHTGTQNFEQQHDLSTSSSEGDDSTINSSQLSSNVVIWGRAKGFYKPTKHVDINGFDVLQEITKKDFQETQVTFIRTKSSSSITRFFHLSKHNLQHSFSQSVYAVDRTLEAVDSKARFSLVFPELNDDQYQAAFRCRLINPSDRHSYEGQLFACVDYVCFYIERIDSHFEQIVPLRITCPFIYIRKILKASKINNTTTQQQQQRLSSSGGELIEVVPLDENLKPNVIQLWTNDDKVHQFTSFGPNFDCVYLKLNQLYRSHFLV